MDSGLWIGTAVDILRDWTGLGPAELGAYAALALLCWTGLIEAAVRVTGWYACYTATTPDPHDDERAAKAFRIAQALHAGTMALWRWLPRVAWGRQPPEPPARGAGRTTGGT